MGYHATVGYHASVGYLGVADGARGLAVPSLELLEDHLVRRKQHDLCPFATLAAQL